MVKLVVNEITPDLLRKLREEINTAIAVIAKKYNLNLKCANATYDATSFKFKLEGGLQGAPDPYEKAWKNNAQYIGLNPDWLGKDVTYAGKQFVVKGLKPRGSSVLIEANGRMFRASIDRFKVNAKLVKA